MQHQVVLQADRQPEGQRVDARDLLADHHPVAVVRFARTAVLLTDLQGVDARLGRPGEDLAVNPVFPIPIGLMRRNFAGQELPHRFPIGLVIGLVQRAFHYRRSMIVTLAWPPPSHMVCSP